MVLENAQVVHVETAQDAFEQTPQTLYFQRDYESSIKLANAKNDLNHAVAA